MFANGSVSLQQWLSCHFISIESPQTNQKCYVAMMEYASVYVHEKERHHPSCTVSASLLCRINYILHPF